MGMAARLERCPVVVAVRGRRGPLSSVPALSSSSFRVPSSLLVCVVMVVMMITTEFCLASSVFIDYRSLILHVKGTPLEQNVASDNCRLMRRGQIPNLFLSNNHDPRLRVSCSTEVASVANQPAINVYVIRTSCVTGLSQTSKQQPNVCQEGTYLRAPSIAIGSGGSATPHPSIRVSVFPFHTFPILVLRKLIF